MARQTFVRLTDDIDPELEAEVERTFAIDGTQYAIDLSKENAELFDTNLAVFVEHARVVSTERKRGRPAVSTSKPKPADGDRAARNAAIRAWAQSHDFNVGAKGRIAVEVVEAYDEWLAEGGDDAAQLDHSAAADAWADHDA